MTVMSLFDGMSCGQIALKKLKVPVVKYYASEVDPHAIKVAKMNFPETHHLGDVGNWRSWDLDWGSIDLICAGSPCQGFSFAGKQLAFDDPRSRLFFVFIDILRNIQEFNPNVKFLLENVRMKKTHRQVISKTLGVAPVELCSSLISAQERKRLYWANWTFSAPKENGLLIRDILTPTPERRDVICDIVNAKVEGTRAFKNTWGFMRSVDQKAKCLLTGGQGVANSGATNIKMPDGTFRRFSAVEAERLQTVPDNYTAGVSNTQRHRMLGNGWTVDVVAHILKPMVDEKTLGELF